MVFKNRRCERARRSEQSRMSRILRNCQCRVRNIFSRRKREYIVEDINEPTTPTNNSMIENQENGSRTSIQNDPDRFPMKLNMEVLKQTMEDNYKQFQEGCTRLIQNHSQRSRTPNIEVLKQRMEDNYKQFEKCYAKYIEKSEDDSITEDEYESVSSDSLDCHSFVSCDVHDPSNA